MENLKDTSLFTKPIAHRGFWNKENPENTIGAFRLAVENGYPIETDIRLSSDGEVVIFHDDTLGRLTEEKGRVIDLPYNRLKELKIGESNFTVPLFSDLLELVKGAVPLLVEIKTTEKNDLLCKKALEILSGYNGEFAVQSFNPQIITFFAKNAPHIIRGQLACLDYGKHTSKLKALLLRSMFFNFSAKPHFVSYRTEDMPNKFVDKSKSRGILTLAWTIRSREEYKRIKGYADNVIFELEGERL